MDNQRRSSIKQIAGIPAVLAAIALLCGPQAGAQQQAPKLTASYAKAALESLHAIESDTSAHPEKDGETAEPTATQRAIDASDAAAVTEQEESISKMLRQIYRLRLHDNKILEAYEKLIEVERAQDESDEAATKKRKDAAAAQLADNEETIVKREESCFWQLEDSLRQRSPQSIAACSEWIRKGKMAGLDEVKPPVIDKSHPVQRAENRGSAISE